MKTIDKSLASLKEYSNNPRINAGAVDAVANSIKEFGFKVPIIIDTDGVIIAGHTRYLAAKKLNLRKVPCIIADDLTEEQVKKFRLVDNKVSEYSLWDEYRLAEELEQIHGITMSDFGFNDISPETDFSFVTGEINSESFSDEKFKYKCPCCGFRWS